MRRYDCETQAYHHLRTYRILTLCAVQARAELGGSSSIPLPTVLDLLCRRSRIRRSLSASRQSLPRPPTRAMVSGGGGGGA